MVAHIVAIDTPSLGDRSYLVHDGRWGFLVDPQRDIDQILALVGHLGVTVTDILETHMHADHVTGGLVLAGRLGAAYRVPAAERVAFDRVPVAADDLIRVGDQMVLRAVATPGHTAAHLSYALLDDLRPAVFTGGSLLCGTVGRTDLPGAVNTAELARLQVDSTRRLVAELPDRTGVFPTHGPGSPCAVTAPAAGTSTIGRERRSNPMLTGDAATVAARLLAGTDALAGYHAEVAAANAAGPPAPDLRPPDTTDADELQLRLASGEWVVDLRDRASFAAAHLSGSLFFGLDGEPAPLLATLMPKGAALTLLGANAVQVALAQRELARLGLPQPVARATGGPVRWATGGPGRLAHLETATFADLAAARGERPVTVLDVRDRREHDNLRLGGALAIPLQDLPGRLGEVPNGEVWVHCADGYRAMVAGSLLAAAGRRPVVIDDVFDPLRVAGVLQGYSPA